MSSLFICSAAPVSLRHAAAWSAELARPITLKDATELRPPSAAFILALPERYGEHNAWKRAIELLIDAAENGGSIEAAR